MCFSSLAMYFSSPESLVTYLTVLGVICSSCLRAPCFPQSSEGICVTWEPCVSSGVIFYRIGNYTYMYSIYVEHEYDQGIVKLCRLQRNDSFLELNDSVQEERACFRVWHHYGVGPGKCPTDPCFGGSICGVCVCVCVWVCVCDGVCVCVGGISPINMILGEYDE
jgi:hypothetical protein